MSQAKRELHRFPGPMARPREQATSAVPESEKPAASLDRRTKQLAAQIHKVIEYHHARGFAQGARVNVYRQRGWRIWLEGRATVIETLDAAAHRYRVQFDGERGIFHERVVHPGIWQDDPETILQQLQDLKAQAISVAFFGEAPAQMGRADARSHKN